MSMSNDPLTINIGRLADLLRGLGLDPVDVRDIRSIHIADGHIEVVRFRRNDADRMVRAGDLPATETVTIGITYDDE